MAFKSQLESSKVSSRRGGGSQVVVTQSYKPSTDSQELSLRVASDTLKNIGLKIGDYVDVLHDDDSDMWMIKRCEGGFKISGKEDSPTGLIRYTLKKSHAKFTEDKATLPIRKSSDDESLIFNGDSLTFKLL